LEMKDHAFTFKLKGFTNQIKRYYLYHINRLLKDDQEVRSRVPILEKNFAKSLDDGIILARFLIKLNKECLDWKRINTKKEVPLQKKSKS
jgi:hypothetical protein